MNAEIEMEQHKCRICLRYTTDIVSVHDQVTVGVSYLDITLIFAHQLKVEGCRSEPMYICVPCANMAKTAYNFKALCEEADQNLECTEEEEEEEEEEIIIQEKEEDVEIEEANVTICTSSAVLTLYKTDDDSDYEDYRGYCVSPTEEDNYAKLLQATQTLDLEILKLSGNESKQRQNYFSNHEERLTLTRVRRTYQRSQKHRLNQVAVDHNYETRSESIRSAQQLPKKEEILKSSVDVEKSEVVDTNSADLETVSSDCPVLSPIEESDVLSEDEQMLADRLKNEKNLVIKDAIEIYTCRLCDKTFSHRPIFRNHCRTVHNLVKLPCYYCEYVPESPNDYAKHAETEHADKKSISCNHCNKTFYEIRALKVHLLIHSDSKKYVCEVCGSKFALKNRLIKHLRAHKENKPLKCSECGKCYRHLESLKGHIESKKCEAYKNRNGQIAWDVYGCKICNKKFTQRSSLRYHYKAVHKFHEISCYFCDFLPESPDELTNHIAQDHADKKSWVCKQCGKTFLELRALKAHLLVHKGTKNYMCDVCGDKFNSKFKLLQHMRRHTGEKPFSCSACGRKFRHSSTLKKHMTTHECDSNDEDESGSRKANVGQYVSQDPLEIYVCKTCGRKFKQRSSLRKHSKMKHNFTEISCYYCEYMPETPSDLAKHTEKEHADKKMLICDLCGRTFFEVRDLKTHFLIHDGIKNYECQICSYRFTSKSNLVEHVRVHTGEKPLKCPDCGRKFRHHSTWKRHMGMQDCKVADERMTKVINKIPKGTLERYICKICDTKFKQRSSLRNHYKIVHDIHEISCYYCDYMPESPGDLAKHTEKEHSDEKKLTCDQCDKTFFEIRDLKAHLLVHYGIKKYECDVCKHKFVTKSNLITHMRKHTGEKPYECIDCNSTFKQQHSLKNHIANESCKKARETNSKDRKRVVNDTAKEVVAIYGCKVCGRKFSQRSALRTHTKSVHKITLISCFFCDYIPESPRDLGKHTEKEHADKKTLTCEHCNKAFFEVRDLRVHLIVHNTIKNHVCKICGYKFALKSNLVEHMTIHTGEKPYKCSICDRSFRLQPGLKKHMGTHSNLVIYPCSICDKTFTVLSNLEEHKISHEST